MSAKHTDWIMLGEEIATLAEFHATCAVNIEQALAKSDIKAMPSDLLQLQRRSIIKHREWSVLLRALSKIQG
jgi:argininosuccinate lyase